MIKTILVAYDGSPHSESALEYARFLAQRLAGKIDVVHVVEPLELPLANPPFGLGVGEPIIFPQSELSEAERAELERHRAEQRAEAAGLLERAKKMCEQWGVSWETKLLSGGVIEEVSQEARTVDLVAIGKIGNRPTQQGVGSLTEGLIRTMHRPVLVAPKAYHPPDQVELLYDGSNLARSALDVSAEIAKKGGLAIRVITVALTQEEAEGVASSTKTYLQDHGVAFTCLPVPVTRDKDEDLARLTAINPKALVVMGAFGNSRLREWVFGSTTRKILGETDNPLLLIPAK